jgi:hypothetical protein
MGKKKPSPVTDCLPSPPSAVPRHLTAGLTQLLRAFDYAADCGGDAWQFALEIADLQAAAMTKSDLRWLVGKGFCEHGREITLYGDPLRTFQPGKGFAFLKTTAFVLSPQGAAWARGVVAPSQSSGPPATPTAAPLAGPASDIVIPSAEADCRPQSPSKPHWNGRSRELLLDGRLIKAFRVPAGNQEIILSAFQEEGWPDYIDDPLPVKTEMDPKRRLHNVINRLNGNQVHPLIHFHGNGSGETIASEQSEPQHNHPLPGPVPPPHHFPLAASTQSGIAQRNHIETKVAPN